MIVLDHFNKISPQLSQLVIKIQTIEIFLHKTYKQIIPELGATT